MIFKDYYKILELQGPQANLDEIKQAYREQAKKYHPDINNSSTSSQERFKDINEAYKTLSDLASKKKYDRAWNTHIGKKQRTSNSSKQKEKGYIFSEFFKMLFGEGKSETKNTEKAKNKKNPIKGENVETEIKISIVDAFLGAEKSIALRTVEGKMKQFKIKIPAGIRNNEKIRLIGQGKPGIDGGKPGDLLIKIHIENSKEYVLNGFDLHTNLLLTPWEAALGTKVMVNSIDEEIAIYVPKGTQNGEKIRIGGKGYLNGKGGRGDLIVNIQITIPKEITEEEREIFKKLKEISRFNPRKSTQLT